MIDFDFVWQLTLRDTDISEHLITLYGLAVAVKAKTILEIGAGQSTFVLLIAAVKNKGDLYSIDLTKESRNRLFPEAPDINNEPKYHFIQGDSQLVEWDKEIDFLFIDSGHSYDLTMAELKKFTPFIKEGGFILMHDTGEFNNVFIDCRRAMLDFLNIVKWEYRTLNNQNGLTIIRKI